MKLWSVGVDIGGEDTPIRKAALLRAVKQIRELGPGTLMGTNENTFNVVFAEDKARCKDGLISEITLRMKAEGARIVSVYACEIQRDAEWPEIAELLGIDAEALKSAARTCYGEIGEPGAKYGEPVRDTIELVAHVEGIDEAIRLLKILEAQLHGVQSMAAKIGEAIDGLQLKLENRIAALARPDR